MGRGRQKAKHTKVARELKYFSPETNYRELERELSGPTGLRELTSDDSTGGDAESSDSYAADWTREER